MTSRKASQRIHFRVDDEGRVARIPLTTASLIVDPEPRRVEVYERDGTSWRRIEEYSGDVEIHARPFDAVGIDLAPLWSWPPPDKSNVLPMNQARSGPILGLVWR